MLNVNTAQPANVMQTVNRPDKCNCPNCHCCTPELIQVPDTFTRRAETPMGIIPPKDWKPDPFVGLGPELSPQEKLKKKYEDLMKPMYANQAKALDTEETPKPKTFKEKLQDFGQKIKQFFKDLPKKIMCKV